MRKVSLDGSMGAPRGTSTAPVEPSTEILELFFDTGVTYHEVSLSAALPDLISGFVIVPGENERAGDTVRRAAPGEEPDVEISAVEHLPELSGRWLPAPYQLSCLHCVQVHLQPGERPGQVRVLLAIDTTQAEGSAGRRLDAAVDGGRPFRPLDKN